MKVVLASRHIKKHLVEVATFAEASNAVRTFINNNDLTAGCGSSGDAFKGGQVFEGKTKVAQVSYNGRVWDLNEKEIQI